ncbi:type II toxin-antitoxin system mRNA interferase toxin, RelE/StbE family [Patescibacteria group bacterium]|nr:type II toxin-antitoxin system mRNA interferase toxin, RelE/StbE family [Patescibacteria group bacterium]
MIIIYSSNFIKKYKKLPTKIKRLAEEKEGLFKKDIFDPSLKTHKLHGKFKDFYSFSINHTYRIIFEISKKKEIIVHFLSIDNHSIYKTK